MSIEKRLEAAATRWSDYVGTAAADDSDATIGHASLYEVAGIDRDRWLVVAIDVELADATRVVVYAVDRTSTASSGEFNVEDIVAERGHLPVTAMHLSDVAARTFLDRAFGRVAIRLTARSFRDDPLYVSSEPTGPSR